MPAGNKYGTHRVIEPKGVLPQTAWKIDNNVDMVYDNEILCKVITLNVDSASFTQIENQANGDEDKIAEIILDTVNKRGKQHNPVTGSGGMFIGIVEKIGEKLKGKIDLKEGDKIASLVSLSLTPLKIDKILKVNKEKDQVDIEGKAILFESGIWAKLPDDLPQSVALAALDVAGAAPQVARLVKPGHKVLIIGAGGKSGVLCGYEAKKRAGVTGKVIGITHTESSTKRAKETGFYDAVLMVDATNPLDMLEAVSKETSGELCDVVINCVNVENTEMGSILCTKDRGIIYFFSMATSFTKAALGAEGVGKDVDMLIGNGYAKDHATFTLNLLYESPILRKIFEEQYK
ncbi:MAG: L-erythro-3,5-diaminohexanoate dehydrogenase [Spirochaetes bacterium]|nr:L-erythro-3,5-diaminohexanoate dehydrogenase [Spirochaetota bacterium]